jgi:ABC-type sugar transport system ATPase subunit
MKAFPVLEMSDVTMRFGGVAALQEVSLQLTEGTVMGLLGQNGAGKSTLMKILGGQYPTGSYQGSVVLRGQRVDVRSPQDAARLGIGLVPQETSVVPTLTVAENILLGQYGMTFITQNRMVRTAQAFLDSVGIDLDASRLVATVSPSERQLVMIAHTLYAKPSLLVLDEPTTALTENEVQRLHSIIRDLTSTGVSTILITHRLDEVFDLADSIVVFRDGRHVYSTNRSEFDRATIVRQIAGRDIEEVFPHKSDDPPTDRVILDVQELTVPDPRNKKRPVVDGISFHVRQGEVLGLGGALGSGRTEVLESIYGLRSATAQSLTLDGVPLEGSPGQRVSAGVGFVPEERKADGLFFNGTVSDNLSLASLPWLQRFSLIRRKATRQLVADQVDKFSIKTRAFTSPMGTLSGGNQQKVLIARALARSPRLILLDEPTKGVDVGSKMDIYQLVRRAADDGAAVVVVSSEATELIGMCDRVLVLYKGKISHETLTRDVSEEDLLAVSMSGRVAEANTP